MFDLKKAAEKASAICREKFPQQPAVAGAIAMLDDPDVSIEHKKRLLVNLGILAGQAFIGPQVLHLDIVGVCNLNCIYCRDHSPWRTDRETWREMEMPFDLISGLVDEGVELGTSVIPLLGAGEPLMHSRFADIVVKIKSVDLGFEIFTNGVLFEKPLLDLFLDARRARLHFSISAADDETYRKFRPGVPGELLPRIERNIRYLTEHRQPGLKVIVVHVLNKVNSSQTIPMMEKAIEMGVDEVQYKLTEYQPYTREIQLSDEEIHSIADELQYVKRIAHEAGVQIHDNIDIQLQKVNADSGNYAEKVFDDLGCHIGWDLVRVRRDGEVSFCCALKFLDHLKNTMLTDYWYGEKLQAARLAARGFPVGKNLEIPEGQKLFDHQCDYCYNYIFNFHSRDELAELKLLELVDTMR